MKTTPRISTMAHITRRGFIERLSLTTGAALLSPMVKTLVAQAQGTLKARKRLIIVTIPNGMNMGRFTPTDLPPEAKSLANTINTQTFSLPPMFVPLQPWKSRLLMTDGYSNMQGNGGHNISYAGFACVPNHGERESSFTPGGQTFDQYMAGKLGPGTAFSSIHLGATDKPATLVNQCWAKGDNQPVPIQCSATDAVKTYFAGVQAAPSGGASAGPPKEIIERGKLFDFLLDDIKRVQGRLAGAERAKMDEYLAAVADTQSRLGALQASAGKCATPGSTPAGAYPEQRFDLMIDIGAAAVMCGLTNVLTVSYIGIGSNDWVMRLTGTPDTSFHDLGHGQFGGVTTYDKFIDYFSKGVARMASKLDSLREGDQSILDQSVIMYISDNGEQHHSRNFRTPLVLIGDAGKKLKTDGRYLRYPTRNGTNARLPEGSGPAGMRVMADVFTTLSHALGHPTDWGKGGKEPTKGPLTDILL
jgi:hypothetical protein